MDRPRILFRIAAGPRIGFGHLIRATRLASAIGAPGWMSVSGARTTSLSTAHLVRVRGGIALLDRLRPDVLILDTPLLSDGSRWATAARRRRIPVISLHDAGIAPVASDLAIDGSVAARGPIRGARRTLRGPRYAVIDPRVVETSAIPDTRRGRIVVALGGGTRANVASRLSMAIASRIPDVSVVVAGGFLSSAPRAAAGNVEWLGAQDGLAHVFATADVAVVAGGVTLYESGAARVPAVPVAIVPAQQPAIRAFARAGAAVDPRVTLSGNAIDADAVARVVRAVAALIEDTPRRKTVARAGRRLVDGRGAERVAAHVVRLIGRERRAA